MYIMQYEITVPADYDMGIIRTRVATRGSSFDSFPGLALKCFLIREKGRHGAGAGQYAPVYLWPHEEQMWGFLAGPAFAKIKDDFGVPPVATWPGFAFARSSRLAELGKIASVTRTMTSISPTSNLETLRSHQREDATAAIAHDDTLLARAVGLDPRNWGMVLYDFWTRPQSDHPADGHSYEVLHSSAPALAALASE